MVRLVKSIVAISLIALVAIGSYLAWAWNHELVLGSERRVVKTGVSMHAFAHELHREGVLPDRYSLVLLALLKGQGRALKAGEYQFGPGMTQRALLDQVVSGKVIEYPLALIEGWTFQQVLQAIHQAPKIENTLGESSPKEIMEKLGYPGLHPEGQFYPDTYYYSVGTSDLSLLRRAFTRMQARVHAEWADRESGLPLNDPYDALKLASIVEKETGLTSERQLIAGVFINRLRRGTRLQSDPTVIYGLGDSFNGNLTRKDLLRDSPYSTYTRSGLPVTPIAMPGGDALYAVLHPAATKALYFVARGDGSHQFSETLSAHNKAVIKYQLAGRNRDFSSHSISN
ncbi:MAG: endolytic transglycosylase MltG [Acidiferrobacterales bacterium]